jgi:hypothetical protein
VAARLLVAGPPQNIHITVEEVADAIGTVTDSRAVSPSGQKI